jgi:hypothetical protein
VAHKDVGETGDGLVFILILSTGNDLGQNTADVPRRNHAASLHSMSCAGKRATSVLRVCFPSCRTLEFLLVTSENPAFVTLRKCRRRGHRRLQLTDRTLCQETA